MAQFDVHRNRGANRDAIPYVVVVQSAIFDGYKTSCRRSAGEQVVPRESHTAALEPDIRH